MGKLNYRLATDLGSTSLGWAMVRVAADGSPCAVIRAGVRIFGDGRNPKDGTSLGVTRRPARVTRESRHPGRPGHPGAMQTTQAALAVGHFAGGADGIHPDRQGVAPRAQRLPPHRFSYRLSLAR